MKLKISAKWSLLLLLALFPVLTSCKAYKDMQAMKEPRYEVGQGRGAAFCAGCHTEIFNQWSENSRHAVATTNKNFLKTRDNVKASFVLNMMMGEESCHACHGSKNSREGVACETCHGIADPDIPITDTHAQKYRPGLAELRKPEFCAKCHELFPPIMSPYSDWLASEAGKKNITCQDCHMASRDGKLAYHGFDSVAHDDTIYEDDVIIGAVEMSFPTLSVTVENHITAHGVPAGGPSRVLVLEVVLKDTEGRELHRVKEKFYKKFKLMPLVGVMPTNELIEDTQLKSKEARLLKYTLPSSLKEAASRAVITLRFYDVEDQYQGDIEKAHWISNPIAKKEVAL